MSEGRTLELELQLFDSENRIRDLEAELEDIKDNAREEICDLQAQLIEMESELNEARYSE